MRKWVREQQADPDSAFPGYGVMKPEQQEIERLCRAFAWLKAERDIPKRMTCPVRKRFVKDGMTATLRERTAVADSGEQYGRVNDADAGDGRQPPRPHILAGQCGKFVIILLDPLVEQRPLNAKVA